MAENAILSVHVIVIDRPETRVNLGVVPAGMTHRALIRRRRSLVTGITMTAAPPG